MTSQVIDDHRFELAQVQVIGLALKQIDLGMPSGSSTCSATGFDVTSSTTRTPPAPCGVERSAYATPMDVSSPKSKAGRPSALTSSESRGPNSVHASPSCKVWTPEPGEYENHTLNCVDWFEAYAFCIFAHGSRVELRGRGAEQREYPWGGTGAHA